MMYAPGSTNGAETTRALHDRAIEMAAAVKHSRLARVLAKPAMDIQFMRRDAVYAKSADSSYIKSLKDSRKGSRCFVIGNGPSLTVADLEMIACEDTFASNGIVNLFSKTSWKPTYYLSVDREYIAHEAKNMPDLPVGHVFVNLTPFSKGLAGQPNVTLLNKRPAYFSSRKYTVDNIAFSNDPSEFIAEGYTVTYAALQLALYMGYSEIYLIGMDHTYSRVANSDGDISRDSGVVDHCFKDTSGTHVNPQYREGVEFAYLVARIAAEQRNASIYNATRGGALEIFERVDLDKVLKAL